VRGEEDRHATGILLTDQVEESALHQRVEAGSRLIQEEQLGAMQQALDDTHLLLVAVREIADATVHLELHRLRQRVHPAGAVVVIEASGILEQVDDLHAFVVVDFRREVPDIAPDLRTVGGYVLPEDPGSSTGRVDQR